MSSLKEMADEYLRNTADMEKRIHQLEEQLKHTRRLESQRKLRRRINILHVMVSESRRIAFQLEHYYDKPEEVDDGNKQQPKRKRGRPRKRCSGTGYGVAAPAAVERSGDVDTKAVSGLCATLSGRRAAEDDCG